MSLPVATNGSLSIETCHTEDDIESASSAHKASDVEAFYYDGSSSSVGLKSARPVVAASAPEVAQTATMTTTLMTTTTTAATTMPPPAAPASTTAPASNRPSQLYPLSKHSLFTLHTPLPTTAGYVDPFVAVQEQLWLLPSINEIVSNTLDRLERAFAYNSVHFLKVILDLQSLYLSIPMTMAIPPTPTPAAAAAPPTPPPTSPPAGAILSRDLVLRIAVVLSGRLARKESDTASPSRELQLRTLISAISLLYQLNVEMATDVYAQLLQNITKRDAENEARRLANGFGVGLGVGGVDGVGADGAGGGGGGGDIDGRPDSVRTGENDFLTRYACDLIRCFPNDLPVFVDLNSEAVHSMAACGFIVSEILHYQSTTTRTRRL